MKDGDNMKFNLKKSKHKHIIDNHLMTFEIINHTYVMLSKKLSQYLSINQQISFEKFISLFNKNSQEKITKILTNKSSDSSSIIKLNSNQYIKLIFNEQSQIGFFIPIQEIKAYTESIENLERTVKTKDAFLYEMSHELKTPLQTLISTIDLLNQSELTSIQQAMIHDMTLALDQAINSTNNILNLAKLEHGAYELKKDQISITQLIDDLHHMFKSILDQKNLYFRTTHYNNTSFISDESLIKQVLTNILSNAIKFTSEGGIYIETDLTSDDILKITIEDTGIGMTDDELKRIFKPFTQANSNISKIYGGTGLGLMITSKILNVFKGDIHMDSTYGTGTKITISIPVTISNNQVNSKSADDIVLKKGIKILIAEDNTLSLKVTKQLLENVDSKVETAKNGIEVLNQFKDYPFDIILMDVSMPKMNGFEATRALREKDNHIPIIAMTANTYDNHIKSCYDSGMTDILYKPFKAKDLYQIIQKHIK